MAKILKSALIGGFRKKDVIEYLEELNLECQKEQEAQAKENRSLSDTIAELHARLEQQEKDLQEAREAAEALQAQADAAEAALEERQSALDRAADALEESKAALEQQLAAEQQLRVTLEETVARMAELEAQAADREAVEAGLRDRLTAGEAEAAAQQEKLRALAAELAAADSARCELEQQIAALTEENEKLRQPAETAKRVVEAVPELVRTAVDAVPDSVKTNLAETAETAKRKVVAIHRKVTEWGQKQAGPEAPAEEDILVDSEMAPEMPEPEYKAQVEPMTAEDLLEKCKSRLGEVAREFNDLYQAVVSLENREKQAPAQNKGKLGYLSSIKEILDRVRTLGDKK